MIRSGAMPRSISASRACSAAPHGAGDAAREVDREDVVAGLEQRLVDREEVADRRLRRARQRRRRAHVVVERVVVGEIALAVGPPVPVHVQGDEVQPVALRRPRAGCSGSYRSRRRRLAWRAAYPRAVAIEVLVTGATGFIGSHLVARCSRAATTCASPSRGVLEARSARGARRRARQRRHHRSRGDAAGRAQGVERVFHVAGTTNLRKAAGGRPAHQRARARARCSRRPGREASSASSTCRRSRRSARRGRAERSTSATCTSARSASRTRTPSTPPRSRRCASPPVGSTWSSPARRTCSAAATSAVVDRGRPSLPAAPDPRLRRRRDQHRRRRGRRGRVCSCARSAGAGGERYILGNRNYTWKRLFGELARLSGVDGPAVRVPLPVALALAETAARLLRPDADHAGRGARRRALVDVPLGQGAPRARLDDAPARGHRRGDRALVTRSGSATGSRATAAASRCSWRMRRPARDEAAAVTAILLPLQDADEPAVRVRARRARAARRGIEVEERRVPWRKARPRRGRRADRPGSRAGARARPRGDLRLAPDRRAPALARGPIAATRQNCRLRAAASSVG